MRKEENHWESKLKFRQEEEEERRTKNSSPSSSGTKASWDIKKANLRDEILISGPD